MSVHVAFRTDAVMRFVRVTGGASYHRHFDVLDDHDFFFDLDNLFHNTFDRHFFCDLHHTVDLGGNEPDAVGRACICERNKRTSQSRAWGCASDGLRLRARCGGCQRDGFGMGTMRWHGTSM